MSGHRDLDLASIRASLAGASGPEYWRSLEELANTDAFQDYLHREFPEQASEFTDPVGRRQFLRLMGASLALAGVTACTRQPAEVVVPYVRAPEEIVPGRPLFFATAVTLGGYATGVLVESHEGRPTKIEGNPGHPASLGATDLFAQAQILALYDPDRSQTLKQQGDIRTWSAFLGALRGVVEAKRGTQGAGLRILTATVTSPTLARQMAEFLAAFPAAKWHQYEAAGRDNVRAGAQLAYGAVVDTRYAFDKARVVVSLDADFLGTMPGSVRYIRDFAAARRVRGETKEMSRLYAVESAAGNTGAKADHRVAAAPVGHRTRGALACIRPRRSGRAAGGGARGRAEDAGSGGPRSAGEPGRLDRRGRRRTARRRSMRSATPSTAPSATSASRCSTPSRWPRRP